MPSTRTMQVRTSLLLSFGLWGHFLISFTSAFAESGGGADEDLSVRHLRDAALADVAHSRPHKPSFTHFSRRDNEIFQEPIDGSLGMEEDFRLKENMAARKMKNGRS